MKRSERLRQEGLIYGCGAFVALCLATIAASGLWAILGPYSGLAIMSTIAVACVASFVVAVFVGHSIRCFAASERERHREAQRLIRPRL